LFSLRCSIKEGNITTAIGNGKPNQPCHRLIVFCMWHQRPLTLQVDFFGGCGIKEGKVTNATGNDELFHQCCRLIVSFGDVALKASNPAG